MPHKDPDVKRQYMREYKARNREHMRLLNRQSYERNKEALLAKRRKKYLENLEENRAKFRAYAVNYRNKHREELRLQYKARRALLQNNTLGVVLLQEIIRRDKGICQICGRKVKRKDQSFDHIVPLSCGGSHTQENLQLVHLFCNKRRGAGRLPAQTRLLE